MNLSAGSNYLQLGGSCQLDLLLAFASRPVEQDGISLRFPNGSEFDTAWAVQAKENAARLASSCQHPLGSLKNVDL
jgi:uncharacterized protein (UPF0276 family)